MLKAIYLPLVSLLLFLASPSALSAPRTGLPDEYGSVFWDRDESGKKYYSHADWITEFGKPELRLASDLVPRKNPLISAAVVDGRDYMVFEKPVEEIEFTYRKNIEKEADPVLRTLRADGSVQTISVHEMNCQGSPGNFTIASYKVTGSSNVKLFAILAQAHR